MKKILFLLILLFPSFGFSADYKYIDASERIGVYKDSETILIYWSATFFVDTCKNAYTQVNEYYLPWVWWGVKGWNQYMPYSGYKCLDIVVYDQLKLQELQKQQADAQKITEEQIKKSETIKKDLEEYNKSIDDAKKLIEQKQSTPSPIVKKLTTINEKKATLIKKRIQLLKKQLELLESQLSSLN